VGRLRESGATLSVPMEPGLDPGRRLGSGNSPIGLLWCADIPVYLKLNYRFAHLAGAICTLAMSSPHRNENMSQSLRPGKFISGRHCQSLGGARLALELAASQRGRWSRPSPARCW